MIATKQRLTLWQRICRFFETPELSTGGSVIGLLIDGSPQVASQLPQVLVAAINELEKIPIPETGLFAKELRSYLRLPAEPGASNIARPEELAIELHKNLPVTVADWHERGLISLNEKERLIQVLDDVLTCVLEVLREEWVESGSQRASPSPFLGL